jgi:hypothetical protein
VLLALGGWLLIRDFRGSDSGTTKQVTQFLFAPRHSIELVFEEPQVLRVGESIFEKQGDKYLRIGEIASVTPPSSEHAFRHLTKTAIAEIYSSASPIREGDRLTYIPASESMEWVVSSMLTRERRARLNQLVQSAFIDHQREIAEHFAPIIEQSLQAASVVIWEDLQAIAPEYQERWRLIGERFRQDLVEARLVPVLQDVVWPIIVQESRPLLNQIGEQIWNQASFWRFGWRAVYDMLPLTETDLTRHEFERFVQLDAIPVLEANMDRILQLEQVIFQRIVQNPQVQSEVAASLRHVLNDREAQALAVEMLQRVFVNNPRLNNVLVEIWNSPRAKQVVQLANDRLEYTITAIGEELFGNPHTEITPEFSRVLRYKVLRKDCQWLLLDRKSDGGEPLKTINVTVGLQSTENPFHVPAEKRN